VLLDIHVVGGCGIRVCCVVGWDSIQREWETIAIYMSTLLLSGGGKIRSPLLLLLLLLHMIDIYEGRGE